MRYVRLLAMIGAIMGGYLVMSGSPASAAPVMSGVVATQSATPEAYMRHRGYHHGYRRYYAPRRVYHRRVYRPYGFYYRPRVVCRWRYTAWGPRRVCFRR
jgi:hypothetical protein